MPFFLGGGQEGEELGQASLRLWLIRSAGAPDEGDISLKIWRSVLVFPLAGRLQPKTDSFVAHGHFPPGSPGWQMTLAHYVVIKQRWLLIDGLGETPVT